MACSADRKSTRLNSSHSQISYAVFCLKHSAPTEIYTLSLHDALPISFRRVGTKASARFTRLTKMTDQTPAIDIRNLVRRYGRGGGRTDAVDGLNLRVAPGRCYGLFGRSEEHTSELQSQSNLVCRLLLEALRAHRDLHSFPTRRSSDLVSTRWN